MPPSSQTPCTPSTTAPSSPGPSTAPGASPGGYRSGSTGSSPTTNRRDVRCPSEASGSVDRGGSAATGGGPLEGQLEVLAPRCALILRRIPLCSASGPAPSEPGGRGAVAPAGAEGAGVLRPRPGCGARRGQLGEHIAGKGPRELVFTTDSGAPL